MKLFDALAYARQQCPVGKSLSAFIVERAAAGDTTCQRLLIAEAAFNAPLEPAHE